MSDQPAVAIIGIAGRFPGARTVAEFWRNLRAGVESIRTLTEAELRAAGLTDEQLADPALVRRSGFLEGIDRFDAELFGLSPRDAAVFDPQHRFFLEVAWEAFEDAGYVPEQIPGQVGVYASQGMASYLMFNLLKNPPIMDTVGEWLVRHTGNDPNFLATRVSYQFNLKGPSLSVQTACSSSLVAVHLACQALLSGECDVALAGASVIDPRQGQGYRYSEGEILSPDGHCRPFDAAAQGTVFANAAGAVVLKRLEDAQKDRDSIRAVILGSAINNDGAQKVGYLAPSVEGQVRAVSEALAVAGVAPEEISFIEAHGTGTLLGDPIELAALQQVFGGAAATHRCVVGSVKSNFGHAGEAASVASLIKATLALQHREIPPTVHFQTPNPRAQLEGRPFLASGQLLPWPARGRRRRAGVTGLGAGGTNAHLVLEEAPEPQPLPKAARPDQLLLISGRTPAAADAAAERLAVALEGSPDLDLADAAFTLLTGRRHLRHRRGVVAQTAAQAASALRDPARRFGGENLLAKPGSVAFLFPGGGAQYPSMGRGLFQTEPVYRAAIEECLQAAAEVQGLREALFAEGEAAAARLEAPSLALPALFATEVALTRLLASLGITPSAVIGHSAGEYAAACAAGVLSVADAMSLVSLRGRLFETLSPGGMLSVPLPAAELSALLDGLGEPLSIAAINGPALCAAAGPLPAVAALEELLTARGVESSRVHIRVAAHSAMVEPILPAFLERCRQIRFQAPRLPYLSNVTGTWVKPHEVTDPNYWVRHLRAPVQFANGVRELLSDPSRLLLEVGPGRTLSSLVRQQSAGGAESTLRHPKDGSDDGAVLLAALGKLHCRGAELSWEKLQGPPRRRISLPTYPFETKRHWVEPLAAPTKVAGLSKRKEVGDWFAAPAWAPAGPPRRLESATLSQSGPWLIFDDGSALGDALGQALSGALVVRVQPGRRFTRRGQAVTVRPGHAGDLERLFQELRDGLLEPRRIIDLSEAGPARGSAPARFTQARSSYDWLVRLAQQLAGQSDPVRLLVVASGSAAVGSEALRAPERALLQGPARVIGRELPHVATSLIDVEPGLRGEPLRRLATQLLEEARAEGRGELLALRGASRWVQTVTPIELPGAPPAGWIKEGAAVLITGGLGGIGLTVAEHLARHARARLALLGRSAPSAAQQARLQELAQLGAEVLVLRADAGDEGSLRAALEQARRRFGHLDAVIHSAGALQDLPIAARGDDTGDAVIAGKALGALHLHELLAHDPPELTVLFSSVSATLGLPGQVDYTAANAYLDALATAARAEGRRVVSVAWNAWQQVGLAVSTLERERAPQDGRGPVPPPGIRDRRETSWTLPLSRGRDWVVGEHVIRGGEAVIPGTGILELFATAVGQPSPGRAIELTDVMFLSPFVVPAGQERTAHLRQRGDELTLDDGSPDSPCATARAALIDAPAPARHELSTLRARCQERTLGLSGKLEQPFVDFGPRWSSVKRIGLGRKEALVELELAEPLRADLAHHPLHPALLDLATGSAQALADGFAQERDFYVPLSYRRFTQRAPLPARLFSHLRLREQADGEMVFDGAMFGEDGAEVASFEGYRLRKVGPEGLTRGRARGGAATRPSALSLALRDGILPAEGVAALDRILGSPSPPHLLASSVDVAAWRRQVDEAAAPRRPGQGAAGPDRMPTAAWLSPRSEAEKEIAALWKELLGVERPGLNDHFFELGGESLIAVRMSVRLRRRFGVELPLASLFEAPTLAGAAAVIDRARGVVPPPSPGEGAAAPAAATGTQQPLPTPAIVATPPKPRKHLVCIEPGGDRLPFFCVHGAGGHVLNFRELALGLPPGQPFWALQARGVDGLARPHASIEEAAADYLAEVRELQPKGPYLLGGYSGGGILAYEMARRLTAAGEQVSLLAFIDTYSPLIETGGPSLGLRLRRMRSEGRAYLRKGLARRRERRHTAGELSRLDRLLARGEQVPPELREHHLFRAFGEAAARYRPQPWSGSAVLFRAEVNFWFSGGGLAYGWDELMPGRVEVLKVPGDHSTLMVEPNATVLVRGLHRAVERAQRLP